MVVFITFIDDNFLIYLNNMQSIHFQSKTDQWATPQDFFNELNNEFHFNLDVCADENNKKCKRYFDKKENGLYQSWTGYRCFMNPPYGRQIKDWIKKASLSKAEIVVAILPARTDTRWFHDYIYNKTEIRFLKGRLKFGNSKNSAPFPSMVVIFRNAPPCG